MEKNAPGRSFLKVTGILCIIYGVFLVLSTAGSMMSYQAMTSGNMTDEVMAVLEQAESLLSHCCFQLSTWRWEQ